MPGSFTSVGANAIRGTCLSCAVLEIDARASFDFVSSGFFGTLAHIFDQDGKIVHGVAIGAECIAKVRLAGFEQSFGCEWANCFMMFLLA